MQWMNNLTIAIVENDVQKIAELIQDVPKFDDLDKAHEALSLIQEAIKIVDAEKAKTLEIMKKIKQTKAFIENQ